MGASIGTYVGGGVNRYIGKWVVGMYRWVR